MNSAAIVARTPRGEEEIQSRKYGLERNLRYVLILIDGKSSVQDLVEKKGAALPDVGGSLHALAEQGFIAIGDGQGENDCVVVDPDDIPSTKAALIGVAWEVLGEEAGKIVHKLEGAPDNLDGLQEAINSCKKMVRLLIDEKKADQLMARCSAILRGL